MTSKKQIVANRQNALKSTGPSTDPGKAIVAQNARKHGLLAQKLLLPDENQLEFKKFRKHLYRQLNPTNPLEILLLERVIAAAWRLRRLLRIETEIMTNHQQQKKPKWLINRYFDREPQDQTLGAAFARNLDKIDTYDKLRRYEAHLERVLFRALRELQRLQAGQKNPIIPCPSPSI